MRFWVILLKSWKSGCRGRYGGSPLHGTEGPRARPPRQPPARPGAEPCASSPGCGRGAGGGSAGAHPSALSACSNSGRSWTWRSFSTSGAPRWVLPVAGAVTASPGEGARWSREAWGLPCPLSPPLLPHGTQARGTPSRGSPVPLPCAGWGGRAGPCAPSARGRGGLSLPPPPTPHRQLASLRVWMSLLYLPRFLCPSPTLFSQLVGDAGAAARTPGPSGGAPAWALHLRSAAASPPVPALLIHPLSLSVPAPSLCLSLSLFFLLFSSAHRVLGL